MLFNNFLKDLPEKPDFEDFFIDDINPLSGILQSRHIHAPNDSMRLLHQRLVTHLRGLNLKLPFATGARPGDSPRHHVTRHRYNRYFYLVDIARAYQSVNIKKLAELLCILDKKNLKEEEEVLKFLQQYCSTPRGGLVIGAPASPDFFNIYAGVLADQPMGEVCKKYNLTYGRYLDDFLFSSKRVPIGKRKRRAIRQIIEKTGFKINHGKSAVYDLCKGPIFINGIGLEYGGRIFLPRHYLRRIKGAIYSAMRGSVLSPTENQISGMMGVFRDITSEWDKNKTEYNLLHKYNAYRRFKGHY